MGKDLLNVDVITLGAGHSIMLGHLPGSLSLGDFSGSCFKSKSKESIDSFGLFGSTEYNTYYPDVKPEDFTPQDEEFIEPVFRMLSEAIVRSWYPIDFSKKGVLKDSMDLLLGQTVNCDHETNIANAIGSVKEVFWQDSYTENGIFIPAGINAKLRIDGKSNPRIARGIMMNPPSIHSNSVTVRFTWEKSHPNMTDEEFYNKMGSYDKEGKLIRKVATKILSYHETSLVSHGADPYAQKIGDNGKIVNPKYADKVSSQFSDKSVNHDRILYSFTDFKDLNKSEVIHNTMVFNNEMNYNPTNKKDNMDELQKFIESLFGDNLLQAKENQEKNSDTVINLVKELVSSKSSLTEQVTKLKEELNQYKNDNENNKVFVEIGKSRLSEVRTEVTNDYKKLMGSENLDESMITLISNADINTLNSLGKSYKVQLEQKFPLKCNHCGSLEVSRSSSVQSNDEDNKKDKVSNQAKTTEEAMNILRNKK